MPRGIVEYPPHCLSSSVQADLRDTLSYFSRDHKLQSAHGPRLSDGLDDLPLFQLLVEITVHIAKLSGQSSTEAEPRGLGASRRFSSGPDVSALALSDRGLLHDLVQE